MMGYCFFLNNVVISWSSKKQRIVSISITKAKYIALRHILREAIWIRRLIKEMNLEARGVNSVTLYGDNEISIIMTNNVESQYCIKHVNV